MTRVPPNATPSRGAPDRRGNLPPKRPAGPLSPAARREWVREVPLGREQSSDAWKYPPRRHYERIKRKRNALLWAAVGGLLLLFAHHYFTLPPF